MGHSVRECSRILEVGAPTAWGALTARPPASLSGSREWVSAAFSTVDRDTAPFLLAVESDDQLVALLPLALEQRGVNPTLRFVGSPHNDLTDIIALPGHERAAAAAVIEVLSSVINRGWSVDLDEVDPDGALVAADRDTHGLNWVLSDPAPLIDLTGEWRSAASSRRRQQWARQLRRLHESHAVEFRRIDRAEMRNELPAFLRLREERLRAKGHPLDQPPIPLIEAVVPELSLRGRSAFMEMRIDGRTAARDLYLLDGTVAMLWLRALDIEWQSFPCGHLLLRATAETFAADGYEVLDLGRGDEPYKFVFGAKPRVLLRAFLRQDLATLGPNPPRQVSR